MTRLQSVTVEGFRSIHSPQRIDLSPRLTVLAGRNNVGKSAYLQAMAPLAGNRPGRNPLTYRTTLTWTLDQPALQKYLNLRAWAVPDLTETLRQAEALDFTVQVESSQDSHNLTRAERDAPGDSLIGPGLQVSSVTVGTNVLVFQRRGSSVGNHATFTWADGTNPALFNVTDLPQTVFQSCQELLSSAFYIGPLRAAPSRVPVEASPKLTSNGSNLTGVLGYLHSNEPHTVFPTIEAFLREAFPEVRHLEVPRYAGQPALEEIALSYSDNPADRVALEHCGTGIHQALLLAVAVLATPEAKLILIDEPHAYLHPAAERAVMELISAHPEKQYVVATHSPGFIAGADSRFLHLFRRGPNGTEVTAPRDQLEILAELGVTAGDAWANDVVLWVEGPTEVEIFDILRQHEPELLAGIAVKKMPDMLRSARKKPAQLDKLLEVLERAAEAFLPFPAKGAVLFDGDELDPGRMAEARVRARLPVHYLPCNEIENLLLNPEALAQLINSKRGELGLPEVQVSGVTERLDSILASVAYSGPRPKGTLAVDHKAVKGSVVLQRLLEAFGQLRYDKVEDGARLARLILKSAPDLLQPLREAIASLR